MIFQDAREFAEAGFSPRVCVIGSGPAGITIARKLAAASIPVVVLEAGDEEWTEESQDFYKGETIGDQYFELDHTRLRQLGGASNHWAGWCRVLEPWDFEAKQWVEHTGWPIGRADIDPFLPETFDILGLRDFRPDRQLTDRMSWYETIKSEPVLFGVKYRDEIAASRKIALVLNTAATELAGDGRKVTAAKLWSRGAPAGELAAPYFVVATGGLENSRLLLWSNQRSNGGVVPHAAALGRYWMEHPMYWAGDAFLTDVSALSLDEEGEAFFQPTPEAIAEHEILNFHCKVETMPYMGIRKFIAEAACTMPEAAEWVSEKLGQRLQCSSRIHIDWEQPPRAENRVALSSGDRDAAGVPRLELHWKKDELDRRILIEGMRMFGEDLARRDLGRLRIADWVLNEEPWPQDMELAGNHHMGGTRMGENFSTSVVDRDCRVHGMANLYVGGSSVFATAGQCTPTTTITALAVRLGEHLAQVAGSEAGIVRPRAKATAG